MDNNTKPKKRWIIFILYALVFYFGERLPYNVSETLKPVVIIGFYIIQGIITLRIFTLITEHAKQKIKRDKEHTFDFTRSLKVFLHRVRYVFRILFFTLFTVMTPFIIEIDRGTKPTDIAILIGRPVYIIFSTLAVIRILYFLLRFIICFFASCTEVDGGESVKQSYRY